MTLKRSERNSIIEDYRNGIINPDYEVKATKTKGRYTVKKRKVPLSDEQLDELQNVDDNVEEPVKQRRVRTTNVAEVKPEQVIPNVKRSKKENSLFELQNQMNSQMLAQITELTNKVAKLKAWKKKMKHELYEEVIEPQQPQQVEQPQEQQVEQQVEQPVQQQQPEDYYAYMQNIPEQVVEQQEVQPEPEPIMRRTTRNAIDYSKFGF